MSEPLCPVCGVTVQPVPVGRPRRYCSSDCRQAAYRARSALPGQREALAEAEQRVAYARRHKLPDLDARQAFREYEADRLAELEAIAGTPTEGR